MRRRWRDWIRRLAGRAPVKDAIDAELEFHLEMQTRRYIDDGVDPDVARARARQRLGNLDIVHHDCRQLASSGGTTVPNDRWFQGLRQDFSYAFRMLRRAPLFTTTALVTIALGIGATTAIFSVVNDVLLRPLPYPASDRVVMIWNSYRQQSLSYTAISAPEFVDLKSTPNGFDAVSAISPAQTTLLGGCRGGDCEPERLSAYVVSPNLFSLLGVTPQIGRLFTDAEGADASAVILSDALWRRRFGADRDIVGRTANVGGRDRKVIGIMPAGVRFPDAPLQFLKEPADLWLPYNYEQRRTDSRGNQQLAVVARLAPGLPLSRAQTDLNALAGSFRAQFPDRYAREGDGWHLTSISLRDQMIGDVRPELLVLLGAVGVVLLIACANVALLLLARGSARASEFAVRTALGAGRTRLIRQVLVEAALLTSLGGALGVLLAAVAVPALLQLDPASIPRLEGARLDATVLTFSIVVTALTALVLGLAPAIRQSRTSAEPALRDAGRSGGAAPVRRSIRGALVMAEVALALVVLAGAGLLIRSFSALLRVERGFDPSHVVTFQLTPSRTQYASGPELLAFHQNIVDRMKNIPGVTVASGVYPLPMGGSQWGGSFYPEGLVSTTGQAEPHAEYHVAMPDYFKSVRIPLLAGREFTVEDTRTSQLVVIVDDVLARMYWPNESALGKRLNPNGPEGTWATIVAVVGHVHVAGPRQAGEPQIYRPLSQSTQAPMFYTARTTGDPSALIPAVREAVRATDSRVAMARLGPMSALVDRALARERFSTVLFILFGAIALTLSAVGLYGVMAFLVEQRRREIGIRLALGGQPSHVLRRVLAEGLAMTALGVAIGLALALSVSGLLRDLLFGVPSTDPVTYAGISSLLLAVAVLATMVPARRAMRVNPVDVLRT